MYFEYFFSMKEVIDMVDNVTSEQVQSMAQSLFKPESVAVTLLGRLDGLKVNRKLLAC
jgi:predicted Zn-dependent peptidase